MKNKLIILSILLFSNITFAESKSFVDNINIDNTSLKNKNTEINVNDDVTKDMNLLYSDEEEQIIIKKIVEENFEYPHYEVGAAFLSGSKLKQNFDKALFWLAQSSEIEKYDKADYLIAEIYAKGLLNIKKPDIEKGIFFYERAATRGNSEAKLKLVVNYLYNENYLDKENGFKWLNELLVEGDLTAHQLYLSLIINNEDKKTILKQLDSVLTKSDKGDHLSSLYLGLLYLKSSVLERDLDKSKMFFVKSFVQGNLIAEDFIMQIDNIKN